MEIKFLQPDRMNLIGYFLRDILRTNLSSEKVQKFAQNMKGAILFDASDMKATLIFQGDIIKIHQGTYHKINARIKGDLNALLDVALGSNYLTFLLKGKIKVGGNIFKLLKVMRLLHVES
ncbi:MAG: SCP2 sterol-binding domain-containing protein [bacterium]